MAKKILIVLLVLLVILQAFRPEKNNSGKKENDISKQYPISPAVEQILAKACNDCHSNNTHYPWYA
ncbi:MAG: heme-binding domain-containing protein, partial [Sediminibacterium sp.]